MKNISIKSIKKLNQINFDEIPVDPYWNNDEKKELLMHKIHIYPAKFPAFIAEKTFEYAKKKKMHIKLVCDIFCGCGTVALEARRHNIDFLGFDINPIATIISKAKGNNYDIDKVKHYYEKVLESYNHINIDDLYDKANTRLKYWFERRQYNELLVLLEAINSEVPDNIYNNLFKCLFSNSLKPCSKWLSKSIKPQVDPNKICANPLDEFNKNFKRTLKALSEIENYETSVTIVNESILNDISQYENSVDFIITSPPYVTSYEYADLHQLSSLWLGCTDDYTSLRKNSIGSLHNLSAYQIEKEKLNNTAFQIVDKLWIVDKSKAKSVARYYDEMSQTIFKCYQLLKQKGRCLFVIGDTEYKHIKMQNAKFICEELLNKNFEIESICKRDISNKYLTPYRDENGKFSSDKNSKQIYSKEYIIIGRKK